MKRAAKIKFFAGMISAMIASILVLSCASGLPAFGADKGAKRVGPKTVRVPYTQIDSYYGYVLKDSPADGTENGKKKFFIYVWIPLAAPEIGVRMISPIPDGMKPAGKDFVSSTFAKGEEADPGRTKYFDTWIAFERASGIVTASQIPNAKTATWSRIETNDDSSEMPKNPGGSYYNSLMRIESEVSNPLKALVAGLYRVAFTSFRSSDVEGSFLAQIGAPIAIPGVVIGQTIESVIEQINAKK